MIFEEEEKKGAIVVATIINSYLVCDNSPTTLAYKSATVLMFSALVFPCKLKL